MKYALSTMFILVTLIAVFFAYPAWFSRIAFALIFFGIWLAACARVGKDRNPPHSTSQ
jgi:hypothetical protein